MKSPKTVLVVEDDNGIRAAVSSILERHGYNVIGASDGESAIDVIEYGDLVLLDIFLPRLTGDEFLRRIRGKGNYIPVVLMSAAMPGSDALECFKEFKVVDFVAKPFKTADLLKKVAHAASIADNMQVVKAATARLKGFVNRQIAL